MVDAMMKRCKQDETLILNTLIELRKVCIYKNVHARNAFYISEVRTDCIWGMTLGDDNILPSARHQNDTIAICGRHISNFCYQLANAYIEYLRLVW